MLSTVLDFSDLVRVLDVGASVISSSEVPRYRSLLDLRLATLCAFDGDDRQAQLIHATYGTSAEVFKEFLYDGGMHDLYAYSPESGLTSLLEPDQVAFSFFNGFAEWGKALANHPVQTARLDDMPIPQIDFAKMDVQGSELTVMAHGLKKLENCVAIQLEVSFMQLYKNQPAFGEIDQWMRKQGYAPHTFVHTKRWSVAPVVFDGDIRKPGNQLLEADIVYIRNPLKLHSLSSMQVKKLALILHYCYFSFDLCAKLILELVRRKDIGQNSLAQYIQLANDSGRAAAAT